MSKSAFDETFSVPVDFEYGNYAISALQYPTTADAVVAFEELMEDHFVDGDSPSGLTDGLTIKLEWVKFGFGWVDTSYPRWWTGATPNSPRSKPVWMLSM